MASGVEALVREEAWRSERAINGFRAALWTVVCGAILLGGALRGEPFYPGVAFGFVYGVAAGVFGFLWLRRRYHRWVPFVGSVLDVVVLAFIADQTHRMFLSTQPEVAVQQLRDVFPAMLVLLGVNALRFSWRVDAAATLTTAVVYTVLVVVHRAVPDPVALGVHLGQIVSLGVLLGYAARKLRRVIQRVMERDAFARFLPEPVVEKLSADPTALELGGQRQEATVLFSDIRGFTSLSEGLEPEAVVKLLNEYFAEMVDEIFDHQGILDKFIGDGIVAVFGPSLAEDHARRALDCARGMLRRLEALNVRRRERGEVPLAIGIGLHTGPLVAGNIGSPRRLEYTHVGDTVNTASRVEGLTKKLGEPILVSETTRSRLEAEALVELGSHPIRGRQALVLYRGLGGDGDGPGPRRSIVA